MSMPATAIPRSLGAEPAPFQIRQMQLSDIRAALAAGYGDLVACRTDALLMAVIFPVAGVLIAGIFVLQNLLPFVFPLCAGFALVGPLATLWFAALSRQRERGEESAVAVFRQPRLASIQRLALLVVLLYVAWNLVAAAIYFGTFGSLPASDASFIERVFTTGAGWGLIVLGCAAGAVFAAVVLVVSFISFPMVIDRDVTAAQAVATSVQAMRRNPGFVLAWGGVVAAGLFLGSLPGLFGLVIVLPVLGHASWHIYRRMVG
ncbi:MAG: hypothetical protein B7Z80_17950 [Rhodospirillales bacterium 20-64-7]|nr:MAG: hypothetical protein B7Z80_17950 [Rhodospirillales bacterium 20-64-7]